MKIEARWLFVRDVGGPPSPSGLLGGEGRPAQLPYCRQLLPWDYFRFARDTIRIIGLSSISQNPQNPTRLLRLKNANVATTKVIKLAKVGWLAAYDLKRRTRCPTAYRPCCFVI